MLYLLFLFLSFSTTSEVGLTFFDLVQPLSNVGCMNEKGEPVDYWVIIKKPQGTDYFYYDSTDKVFETSPHSLNDTTNGALTHTVKQLWQKDINYVIYNDQIPSIYNDIYNDIYNISLADDDNAGKYGHTKGLFAFAHVDGFWLTHSIPLFPLGPNDSDHYRGLGSNAKTYAQNMLCVTMGITALNDLAKLFLLNRPQIYDSQLLHDDTDYIKPIKQLVDGKYSTLKQCESSQLETSGGHPFKVYAKTAEWNNDLYAGCVTPQEQDTLLVESWIRGKAEGPVCPISDYNTLDIHYLSFVVGSGIDSRSSGIDSRWSETQDHSKWAITEIKDVICMGDINRMTSQYLRGGGTACFTDTILHHVLKQATIKTNTCDD